MHETKPLLAAIAGIGGFGKSHHMGMLQLEKQGEVLLKATCDPAKDNLQGFLREIAASSRGFEILDDFNTMIECGPFDLVTIATPIRCHAPMHRVCVERGYACYLEKPPTLDPLELEEMIALDATARHATQVGFNYIAQPERLALKQRVLDGEFGELQGVSLFGAWRRSQAYYNRARWAGRLLLDNELVLDSCAGNAISHHIHNILFMAGRERLFHWASPESVCAELYRANDIQGADTVFALAELEGGVTARIALTHASSVKSRTMERIECDKAVITIDPRHTISIRWNDGKEELMDISSSKPSVRFNFSYYFDYLRGRRERPATLLSDCRPFVHLNALLYIAAKHIRHVDCEHAVLEEQEGDISAAWSINDIEEVMAHFLNQGEFPSQNGREWAHPGGEAKASELGRLREAVQAIAD